MSPGLPRSQQGRRRAGYRRATDPAPSRRL